VSGSLVASSATLEGDATRWEGRGVRAETVAREMLRMRKGAEHEEEIETLTRASVMNLIVCIGHGAGVEPVIRAADELALRHPSRVIVLAPERAGEEFSLDAEVVIHRHPLATHGLLFERALLRPRGANPEGFDTLVIPLLIPHLQSFLWWIGDPDPADPGLRSLAAICDRLIIDTAMASSSRLALVAGQMLTPQPGRWPVLGDMAWTRLSSIREAVARIFEEGDRHRYLEGLVEVEMTVAHTPGRRSDLGGLLLGGWLASRLGLTSPQPWPGRAVRLDGEHPATIAFARGRRGGETPILGLRLRGRAGRKELEVTLEARRGAWSETIVQTGSETLRRSLPLSVLSETEALSRELARMGRDRVFEDALQMAARIESALD
jgi:glucose-6-phosphate dehydrogenase assembly protein OpcA